jgi:hypothetical protein
VASWKKSYIQREWRWPEGANGHLQSAIMFEALRILRQKRTLEPAEKVRIPSSCRMHLMDFLAPANSNSGYTSTP